MAKSKTPSKAAQIREFLQKDPDATENEVRLALPRLKIASAEVSQARKAVRKDLLQPRAGAPVRSAAQVKVKPMPVADTGLLAELARLAKRYGGISRLDRGVKMLRQFQV